MLASLPVSMLNQSLDDLGIPIRINLTSSRSNEAIGSLSSTQVLVETRLSYSGLPLDGAQITHRRGPTLRVVEAPKYDRTCRPWSRPVSGTVLRTSFTASTLSSAQTSVSSSHVSCSITHLTRCLWKPGAAHLSDYLTRSMPKLQISVS
jgi:hypothetical protein